MINLYLFLTVTCHSYLHYCCQAVGGVASDLYVGDLLYVPIRREWYYEVVITDMMVDEISLGLDCKEVGLFVFALFTCCQQILTVLMRVRKDEHCNSTSVKYSDGKTSLFLTNTEIRRNHHFQ